MLCRDLFPLVILRATKWIQKTPYTHLVTSLSSFPRPHCSPILALDHHDHGHGRCLSAQKMWQVAEFKSFEMWIETAAPNHEHKLGLRASQFHLSSAWNFEFPEWRSNGSPSQWDLWYMDTHLVRAFCNGIYAWQHTRCHLRSWRTPWDPWKHWAPLTGQQRPPPLNPPGVPSSYLLNLLCPQWYGFRRPLSFGLHSGFFNYVVHFTCLCSFTPQDQGHERFHYFKTRSLNRTLPIQNSMIPYILFFHPYVG